MNLLMVNDAVAAVQAMKDEIPWEQYGIQKIYTAYNVAEGQAVIQATAIDILLCDIEMPGEYGIALIRWIRENHYDIDCILLTCHAEFSYAQEAVTLNCQDYLLLPASYESIGATIQKVVNRRQERLNISQLVEYGKSWLHEKDQQVSQNAEKSRNQKDVIEECVSYILSNLDNPELSVNQVASHLYLNAIYLNRIFKREKNMTIIQFIINEKMALAARLLQNSSSSVVAIAEQVGYPNYSYFSTIFKKHYGCTPTQYRCGENHS